MPHFSVKFGDVASPNGTEGAVFNANCQCRILLDQICITAMRELEDYARKRDAGLKAALEELAGQIAFQPAHAPKPPPVEATSKAQGLPEPWVEVTDEKTGKIYYGNTKTGETQFARPE